jgi:DNA repair protein RecO (recombination protein O)
MDVMHAYVLHKKPSGDTSSYVTFFTSRKGIISSLCRGGRTAKKQSLLQQFNPLWVAFDERHERYYASKIELRLPSLQLFGKNLIASLYVNELLYYLLKPLDDHPYLYDLYEKTINLLQNATDNIAIEIILRRFEMALLSSTGYGLSLTSDVTTQLPIDELSQYSYIPGLGVSKVEKGIPGIHLYALEEDNLDDLAVLKIAKIIMRKAIDHALGGRKIQSRDLNYSYNLK